MNQISEVSNFERQSDLISPLSNVSKPPKVARNTSSDCLQEGSRVMTDYNYSNDLNHNNTEFEQNENELMPSTKKFMEHQQFIDECDINAINCGGKYSSRH